MAASLLSFAGTATAADPTVELVTSADIAPTEDVYAGWHQGDANGENNYRVSDELGLELTGKAQVIKGYANNSRDLDARNADLSVVLPAVQYTVTGGDIWLQAPIFFTNDENPIPEDPANMPFTTLRPAEPAGEGVHTVSLDDQWRASRKVSDAILANTPYPLRDILAELDDYKTLAFGVFTDTGKTGSVKDITWDGVKHVFGVNRATVSEGVIEPSETDETYAAWHQGDEDAGAENYRVTSSGGLELTGKVQIMKGYDDNSRDLNAKNTFLAQALSSASYTVTEGDAYFQVPLFFGNETSDFAFTTLRPATAANQGVNTISLDDQWRSSKSVSGDIAANTAYPLRDILAEFDDYKVLGFGVFADTGKTAKIADITWDGTTYAFVNSDPTLASRTVSTRVGVPATIKLDGADVDGNALTYATSSTGATISGETLRIAVPKNSRENRTATVTVDDGRGGTATATYTVRVGKATTTVKLASPKKRKAGKRINAKVKVTSTARVKGARVDPFVGGKKVGTAKLNAAGRATIRSKKLPKGKVKRKVVIKLRATPLTARGHDSRPIRVLKR